MIMWTALRRSAPALLLACGILSLLAFELWRSHRIARQDVERNIETLAHVLSEQTARTIQSIDLNLQSISAEFAGSAGLADNDSRFFTDLRKRLDSLPYARALFVIGADGFILQESDYPAPPRVSLADRAYFIAHKENSSLGLHIGAPLQSRSVGTWFVSLSRRIERPDGSFAGIVVAAMEPLYFEQFYRQLWVGSGTIALFLNNGTLLARSPSNEGVIGTSFATVEPFSGLLRENAQGVFQARSPIDGVQRIVGYRALENVPLVMLVTMNEAEAMQPWRSHMTVAMMGAAILLAMCAGIELLSRRHRFREERALARLAEAERLESIGRFAAGVAHDVGNLLRIVRSAVILLRPQTKDRPKAEGLLDQIDGTMTFGSELVNQLLSYSRTGHQELRSGDLNEFVSEALPMLRRASGPKVEIRALLAASRVMCRTDRAQFHAALLNLVLNARDAMPEGGTMSIKVSLLRADKKDQSAWGEVSVCDEGAGMSKDILKQAFDPFFTTKEPGHGSGVGLSQVQAFADYNQGELEIASEEGKGTTIRLRLPIVDDETDGGADSNRETGIGGSRRAGGIIAAAREAGSLREKGDVRRP